MLVCYLFFLFLFCGKPIATLSTLYWNSRDFEHYYCNTLYFRRISLNFGELKVIPRTGFTLFLEWNYCYILGLRFKFWI